MKSGCLCYQVKLSSFGAVATAFMVLVQGCASYSSATTTLEELSSSQKGAVVMMASFENVPDDGCGLATVEIARHIPSGKTASSSRKVKSRGDPSPGFWIIEAGEYDVHAAYCTDGLSMAGSAGYGQYVTFATFSVAAGEVVNLGRLVFGGAYLARRIAVQDLPDDVIQSLNRDAPKLALKMTKRYMLIDPAKSNMQEAAADRASKAAMTFGNILKNAANNPVYVPMPR